MLFRALFSYSDCNLSREGISQGNNGTVYIAYLHESLVKKQNVKPTHNLEGLITFARFNLSQVCHAFISYYFFIFLFINNVLETRETFK